MLQVESLSKYYPSKKGPGFQALENVSFNVRKGEVYGLIGLSGAGKSTALRCINLLEKPSSGNVIFDHKHLTDKNAKDLRFIRQKMGMIFQHFNLMSNRSVYDNIAFPLEVAGWKKPEIKSRVLECLSLVQLTEKETAYPANLSGGQKQRVAIARAIANRPKILLADEPTSALDPLTKNEILSCLSDLNKKLGLTIVIAAHEMRVIRKLCHRVSLFKDGKIQETLEVSEGKIHPTSDYGKALLEDF